MFKRTRVKIVAAVMVILAAVLACTLAVIYAANRAQAYTTDQKMLARYTELYLANGNPADNPDSGRRALSDAAERPEAELDASFRLASFYSVAFGADGAAGSIDNGKNASLPDGTLTELAGAILRAGRSQGMYRNYVYQVVELDGGTLVAMMDSTVQTSSAASLFGTTCLAGGGMLAVCLLLAVFLARRIVRPLEETYEKQKQFISDAGHELKTPVSVIGANADMLARETGGSKWLDNIVFENGRMAVLIRQMLELARTESAPPALEETDLSRIVVGGVLPFESVAYERALTLRYDVEPGVRILGCASQLEKLVSILTDNAVSHGEPGTDVTVSLKRERRWAVLTASDTGPAIPEDQREKIFERFYRTDDARGGDAGHFGLGLAIAKAVVQTHRGRIAVSCAAGVTRFTVFLPLHRP